MNELLVLRHQDFDPTVPEYPEDAYAIREAARAVLIDAQGQIILLNVSRRGHHKLPGGGVDPGETIEQALMRELLEEVGCQAEIIKEIGQITEYRPLHGMQKQISYCFLARQVGEQVRHSLEADEIALGMKEYRVTNIEAAIRLLEQDKPDDVAGHFIQKRDLVFLRHAQRHL